MPAVPKLSSQQRQQVLQLLQQQTPYKDIAQQFHISQALVSKLAIQHNLRRNKPRELSNPLPTQVALLLHLIDNDEPVPTSLLDNIRSLLQ